ncbi:MAG: hypothetical protein ACE5JK_07845 [Candidatus Omnitrophota bacterium]
MSVYRSVFTGFLVTIMAVGYVHQRVEIVKTGYDLQENRDRLSLLVDQNSKLMYNLFKLESPRSLLASMGNEKIEFAGDMARQNTHRKYRISRADLVREKRAESFIGRFFDFFTVNAEASPN